MLKEIVYFLRGVFKFQYILELPYIFFKPRTFFSIIENEYTGLTVKRLIFYVLTYDLFFLIFRIYLGYSKEEQSTFEYITLVIIDLANFTFYVWPFLLLVKFTIPKISAKTIISYLIIFHLNTVLFYFLFHILFISLENYIFAILRALSIYSMILILIFGYALIFSYTIKNRLKLIFISIFLMVLINLLHYGITKTFNLNWENDIYTLLKDPIGEEAIEVVSTINSNLTNKKFDYPDFELFLSLVSKHKKNTLDTLNVNLSRLEQIKDSLKYLAGKLRYKTSKRFISRGINIVNQRIHLANLLNEFIDTLIYYNDNFIDLTKFQIKLDSNKKIIDSLETLLNQYPDSSKIKFSKFKTNQQLIEMIGHLTQIYKESVDIYDIWTKVQYKYSNINDAYQSYMELKIIFLEESSSLLKIKYYLQSFFIIAPKPF